MGRQPQTDDSALRPYTYFSVLFTLYSRLEVYTKWGAGYTWEHTGIPGSDRAGSFYRTSADPVPGLCADGKKRVVIRPEPATDSAHRSRIMESCDIASRMVADVPLVAAQTTTA